MDIQKCSVCFKKFDFDQLGLEGPGGIKVCSSDCAKKSAESRGNEYAIHNNTGKITESNITPGYHPHLW